MVFGDKRDPKSDDEGGLLPEMLRRAVERSVQAVLQTEDESKKLLGALLPRELVQNVVQTALQAVDVTKREAVEIVGKEMRQFLDQINLSDEIRKVLTSVTFEIKTEVRFVPNEDGTLRSEVTSSAAPRRAATAATRTAKGRKAAQRKGSQAAAGAGKGAPRSPVGNGERSRPAAQPRKGVSEAVQEAGRVGAQAIATTRSRVRRVVESLADGVAELAPDGEDDA
jgi:hypothetical protein